MESNIGVAVIIGLLITSSLYVWNSDLFSKNQKIFLLLLILFPPAHWIALIIVYLYNKSAVNEELKSQTKYSESKILKTETLEQNLNSLKQTGIINDDEFDIKLKEIKNQQIEIENSDEYRQLTNLFKSGILTKEEFDTKKILLKNKFYESENITNPISETEEVFEIGIWNKFTNYHKDLGAFMTIEIITENKQLNGFEINKELDGNKYFLINDLDIGFFDKVEDLLFRKFQVRTIIFKTEAKKEDSSVSRTPISENSNYPKSYLWNTLFVVILVIICILIYS